MERSETHLKIKKNPAKALSCFGAKPRQKLLDDELLYLHLRGLSFFIMKQCNFVLGARSIQRLPGQHASGGFASVSSPQPAHEQLPDHPKCLARTK